MKKTFIILSTICISFGLLTSCSTGHNTVASPFELPAEAAMNKTAGVGGHLTIELHLDTGDDLRFGVDTGSSMTFLPASIEPKLGKRLGTRTVHGFDTKNKRRTFAAPKLFLGTTRLKTGSRVAIWEDEIGLLGMDCLRNYCVQMDFEAGKIRFLDPKQLNVSDLGRPFPLTGSDLDYIRFPALFDEKQSDLLIDTGDPVDANLPTRLFQRATKNQYTQAAPVLLVGKSGQVEPTGPGVCVSSNCVWSGNTYTNLLITQGKPCLLGLRFLARHLVTFDFPGRTMNLKQISVGPRDLPPDSRSFRN